MAIDFSGWPMWVIVLILLATNQHIVNLINKILTKIFGVSLSKGQDKLEADRWQRERAGWREDKAFDLLEGTLEDYREESRERDRVLSGLIEALNRNTNTVSKQTDMIRILAQNAARLDDRIENLEDNIQTRWLGGDEKS